jgi:GNAT superfamily N-acetyltransferase
LPDVEISFDLSRIDFQTTSNLIKESYWGGARTDELNRQAFANSLCAAAYLEGEQVAFGRAITDHALFAYLADIIVWPHHRGRGIGKKLVGALLDHPDLATVVHFSLTTSDAHKLYAQFGFAPSDATCASSACLTDGSDIASRPGPGSIDFRLAGGWRGNNVWL